MASTVFTQARLDAIEESIASGTLIVQYSDKKVTYRTLSDLLTVRDLIRKELGIVGPSSRILPDHTRGVD